MTPNFDTIETMLCEAAKGWGGSDFAIQLLLSYRFCDHRKWRLVIRFLRKGQLTEDVYEKIRARSYRPPTKSELIEKKREEVKFLYDELQHRLYFAAYSDELKNDLDYFGETREWAEKFEQAYFELLSVDPDSFITKDFLKRNLTSIRSGSASER